MSNDKNNEDYQKLYQAAMSAFSSTTTKNFNSNPSLYEPLSGEWFGWWYKHIGVSPAYLKMAQRATIEALYDRYMSDTQDVEIKKLKVLELLDVGKSTECAAEFEKSIEAIKDGDNRKKVEEILKINNENYKKAEAKTRTRLLFAKIVIIALQVIACLGIIYSLIQQSIAADNRFVQIVKPIAENFDATKTEYLNSADKTMESKAALKSAIQDAQNEEGLVYDPMEPGETGYFDQESQIVCTQVQEKKIEFDKNFSETKKIGKKLMECSEAATNALRRHESTKYAILTTHCVGFFPVGGYFKWMYRLTHPRTVDECTEVNAAIDERVNKRHKTH